MCDYYIDKLVAKVHEETYARCYYRFSGTPLERVKLNGLCLSDIHIQTEELCLEAVKETYLALYHVKEQTEEICFEAIRANAKAIGLVRDPKIREKIRIREVFEKVCEEIDDYWELNLQTVIR